jgi:hypothetical protein
VPFVPLKPLVNTNSSSQFAQYLALFVAHHAHINGKYIPHMDRIGLSIQPKQLPSWLIDANKAQHYTETDWASLWQQCGALKTEWWMNPADKTPECTLYFAPTPTLNQVTVGWSPRVSLTSEDPRTALTAAWLSYWFRETTTMLAGPNPSGNAHYTLLRVPREVVNEALIVPPTVQVWLDAGATDAEYDQYNLVWLVIVRREKHLVAPMHQTHGTGTTHYMQPDPKLQGELKVAISVDKEKLLAALKTSHELTGAVPAKALADTPGKKVSFTHPHHFCYNEQCRLFKPVTLRRALPEYTVDSEYSVYLTKSESLKRYKVTGTTLGQPVDAFLCQTCFYAYGIDKNLPHTLHYDTGHIIPYQDFLKRLGHVQKCFCANGGCSYAVEASPGETVMAYSNNPVPWYKPSLANVSVDALTVEHRTRHAYHLQYESPVDGQAWTVNVTLCNVCHAATTLFG